MQDFNFNFHIKFLTFSNTVPIIPNVPSFESTRNLRGLLVLSTHPLTHKHRVFEQPFGCLMSFISGEDGEGEKLSLRDEELMADLTMEELKQAFR